MADIMIQGVNWSAILGWASFVVAAGWHLISLGSIKGGLKRDIKNLFHKVEELEAENKAIQLAVITLERQILDKLGHLVVHTTPCLYTQEFKKDYEQVKKDLFIKVGTIAEDLAKIKGALGVRD